MFGLGLLLAIVSVACIVFFQRSLRKKVEQRIQSIDKALRDLKKEVISVAGSQVSGKKIIEVAGQVRGVSKTETARRENLALAEKVAFYEMLLKAKSLGANAVIETRRNTGTYELHGSKWHVSQVVYLGTAVKI